MTPPTSSERYKNHRFPGEIISHGVWLYYRFTLSYRDVEELLCERGITVTHEAIRRHCQVNEKSLLDAFPLRKAEGVGRAKIQGLVQAQNSL